MKLSEGTYLQRGKYSYEKGKIYVIKSNENLKIALLGGIMKHYLILVGRKMDSLLIDILPFNVYFGPEWGKTIPLMLEAGSNQIPSHNTATFDFIGTDRLAVRIGSRTHSIDIINDFGYAPKIIECDVSCADLGHFHFTVKDTISDKTISYNISDFYMLYQKIANV